MASSKKPKEKEKEKAQKKLIIVHGWEGSPERDWLPWLKGEMERKGWEVLVPAMPNAAEPKVSEWVPSLAQASGKVDENTFMVGHSLGCITILRFLDNLPENASIGGAILVAGFDNALKHRELVSFFEAPINWEKAKRKCAKFVSIHSEDDSAVPVDNSVRLKNNLDAKKIVVNGYGHFAGDNGVTSLPLVLQELLDISGLYQ